MKYIKEDSFSDKKAICILIIFMILAVLFIYLIGGVKL